MYTWYNRNDVVVIVGVVIVGDGGGGGGTGTMNTRIALSRM